MHQVKLRRLDGGKNCGITIPRDILKHAGLASDDEVLVERPELFLQYDPESRRVSFVLPEPSDGTAEAGITDEDLERLRAEI